MFGIFLEDPKGAPPGSWRVNHVKLKPNHSEKSSKNLLPPKPNPPNKTYSIAPPKMVFGRWPSWFMAPFAVWRVMFFCWWNVTHSKGLSNDSWTCMRTPPKNEDVFFLDWHCGWEVPQNEYIVIFFHHHHHHHWWFPIWFFMNGFTHGHERSCPFDYQVKGKDSNWAVDG